MDTAHQGLLSTLTQTQVAVVCRPDGYAHSTQRRYKAPVRGVRGIFGGLRFNGEEEWHESLWDISAQGFCEATMS